MEPKTQESLNFYINFLLDYNNKINLIGRSTVEDIWNRHIMDSLQILKLIDNLNIKVADLGSGAGLPGIPLSISGIKEVHLFEKSPRKCEFLEQAKRFSDNKIIVRNENLNDTIDESFDLIVSRALANLSLLLKFSESLVHKGGKLIFLKGKKIHEEIAEAEKEWNFRYKLHNSITSDEGKIIEINEFSKK